METVVIVIHLMVVAALVASVLLQRSEGGALGIGGGGGGLMSSRGSGNFLTRVTAGLAFAFFTTSIVLSLLAGSAGPSGSIFDQISDSPPASSDQEGGEAPQGGDAGILDQLRQQGGGDEPQVPQSQ